MKLIAMTNKGTEYLHSKTYAFFASDRSAKKICDILNKNRWKCNTELELWHVYDHEFPSPIGELHFSIPSPQPHVLSGTNRGIAGEK